MKIKGWIYGQGEIKIKKKDGSEKIE